MCDEEECDFAKLFVEDVLALPTYYWYAALYQDDFGWAANSKEILSDPGWRFSIRVEEDYYDAIVDPNDVWPWLLKLQRCLRRSFPSYHSQYGPEIHPALWDQLPDAEQCLDGHRGEAWFLSEEDGETFPRVYSNEWRFLEPDKDNATDPIRAWHFKRAEYMFRFDFTLNTHDAAHLRMTLTESLFSSEWPKEWPHELQVVQS